MPLHGPMFSTAQYAAMAPVYVGAWSGAPTAASAGAGALIVATDIPAGGRSYWVSNGSNWKPYFGPVIAAKKVGTTTGALQTADQIIGQLGPLPAGLLADATFSVRVSIGRDVNTDAFGNMNLRIGTAGTTADASIGVIPLGTTMSAAGSVMSLGFETWQRMNSATSLLKLGAAGPSASFSAGNSTNAPNNALTVPDVTANALFISVSTTMGAATASHPQTGYMDLTIYPE